MGERWTIRVRAEGYEATHAFTGPNAEAQALMQWQIEVGEMYARPAARGLLLKCGRRVERTAERLVSRD